MFRFWYSRIDKGVITADYVRQSVSQQKNQYDWPDSLLALSLKESTAIYLISNLNVMGVFCLLVPALLKISNLARLLQKACAVNCSQWCCTRWTFGNLIGAEIVIS